MCVSVCIYKSHLKIKVEGGGKNKELPHTSGGISSGPDAMENFP